MISILMPTRGRFSILLRSMTSILNNCHHPNNIEILLGMDNDDESTIKNVQNYIQQNSIYTIRVIKFERLFYSNFHQYLKKLSEYSVGNIFWPLADDVEICTRNWDEILEKNFKETSFMYSRVHTAEFESWKFSVIPIINKKWIDITGRFANNSQTDLWLGHIAQDLNIINQILDIKTTIMLPADGSQHNSAKFYTTDQPEWLKDKEKIKNYIEKLKL